MAKKYTKHTWVDEQLAGAERYDLKDNGGTNLFTNIQIVLKTAVAVAGDALSAILLQNIENGLDTLDSDVNGVGGLVAQKAAASGIATLNGSSLVVQEPASKAQANGLASLSAGSLVVQNPANAQTTAAAGKIPVADGAGKLDTWVTQSKAVAAQLFLSAPGGIPAVTNGCSNPTGMELATNKENVKYLSFDPSTEQYAHFNISMPSDWDGGTFTAKFIWTHPATTVNFAVVWGLKGRAFGDGEALDQAAGTGVVVTDTGGTTSGVYISPATTAITLAGTPAAGEFVNFTVYRKAADAADTMAVAAYLLGVQLTYTRT